MGNIIDASVLTRFRAPDTSQVFSNILNTIGKMDSIKRAREEAPIRNQLLQQQVDSSATSNQRNQGLAIDERNKRRITSVVEFGNKVLPMLKTGNIERVKQLAVERLRDLEARKLAGEDVDATETEQFLAILDNDPQQALTVAQQAVDLGKRFNLGQQTSSQRERQGLIADLSSDNEQVRDSAAIALRIKAPVRLTKEERFALDKELGAKSIEFEADKAEEIAERKAGVELSFKPRIVREVKLAEAKAAEEGEVFTDLARMNAALPGLKDAIGQLRELAPIATSTLVGRAFDTVRRETGFGASKGATARAKYTSIILNQVLPLLKPTFGTQFTEREGESLKATMGDVNLSPEEKLVQLDAFIEQKIRNIKTSESQLSAAQGQDLSTLSMEQLIEMRNKAQGQ